MFVCVIPFFMLPLPYADVAEAFSLSHGYCYLKPKDEYEYWQE